jgi:hypothetical protein
MFSGPPFQIATRYGQMLNTIFVTMLFSPGLPLLWWTAAATFFVSYWVDKFLFCRYYSTPPLYDESASRVVTGLLPWAVLGHFAVGFWMWSYELLVPQSDNSLGKTTKDLGSRAIGIDEMDGLIVGPAELLLGRSGSTSSGTSLTWTAGYFNTRISESTFAEPYLFCTSMLGLFLALKLFLFDEGSAFMRLLCPCLCRKVDVNASSARASGALGGQKALPPLTHAFPRSVLKDLAEGPRTAEVLRKRASAALEELQEGKPSWPAYVEFRKKCAFADLRSYDMRDNPQYDYVGHSNLRKLKSLLEDEVAHNDVKLPGVVAGEVYVAGVTDDGRQINELTEEGDSHALPNKAMGGFDSFFDTDGKLKEVGGGGHQGGGMPTVSSMRPEQQQSANMSFYSKKGASAHARKQPKGHTPSMYPQAKGGKHRASQLVGKEDVEPTGDVVDL